jgi:hypothetical protein
MPGPVRGQHRPVPYRIFDRQQGLRIEAIAAARHARRNVGQLCPKLSGFCSTPAAGGKRPPDTAARMRLLGKSSSAFGRSDPRLLFETDPGDPAGFRGTGSCISFGRFFHVIDFQELAGTVGPFESQPEFSEHGIDRWCGKFIREVGFIGARTLLGSQTFP